MKYPATYRNYYHLKFGDMIINQSKQLQENIQNPQAMQGHFIAPINLELFACLHQDIMLTHASICSERFKDPYTKNTLTEEKKSQNEH